MWLAAVYTRSAAVLVDEFDAGSFESLPQNNQVDTQQSENRQDLTFIIMPPLPLK